MSQSKLRRIRIIAKILSYISLLICKTLRYVVVNYHYPIELENKYGRMIYGIWHGRLLPGIYFQYNRKSRKIYTLVSPSKDGEIADVVLKVFKWKTIRGDTKYRTQEAYKELIEIVNQGNDIGIVADGPLGPRYKAKTGSVRLASETQTPLLPCNAGVTKAITFNSWDRLVFPLPFAKVYLCFGEPMIIPPNLSREGVVEYNKKFEERLNFIREKADELAKQDKELIFKGSRKPFDRFVKRRDITDKLFNWKL